VSCVPVVARASFVALIALVSTGATTRESCPAHFLDGRAPVVVEAKRAAKTRPLCFKAFAVLHSGVTRTPLWSAQRLTRTSVAAAVAIEGRSDRFHAEKQLPKAERAELADYRKSGFDRGHLAPSGDMPSRAADRESFSLANIVPQARRLNQGSWARLEDMLRDMALGTGAVDVVTGPLFEGASVGALKGRVLVPTSTWKAVHVPGRGAAAYVATNEDRPRWRLVSIAEITRRAGVDPFPSLPPAVKARAIPLPLPTEQRLARSTT